MENRIKFYNTLTRSIETFVPNDRLYIILPTLEISEAILWKMFLKKHSVMRVTM